MGSSQFELQNRMWDDLVNTFSSSSSSIFNIWPTPCPTHLNFILYEYDLSNADCDCVIYSYHHILCFNWIILGRMINSVLLLLMTWLSCLARTSADMMLNMKDRRLIFGKYFNYPRHTSSLRNYRKYTYNNTFPETKSASKQLML